MLPFTHVVNQVHVHHNVQVNTHRLECVRTHACIYMYMYQVTVLAITILLHIHIHERSLTRHVYIQVHVHVWLTAGLKNHPHIQGHQPTCICVLNNGLKQNSDHSLYRERKHHQMFPLNHAHTRHTHTQFYLRMYRYTTSCVLLNRCTQS